MQAKSIEDIFHGYLVDMKTGRPTKSQRTDFAARALAAREAAGLSQREVARRLGIAQPSYALWEIYNVALKPEQITKLAEILCVRVEDLLEEPKACPPRRGGPVGKARQLFDAVSRLPRRQQEKVFDILQPFIAQHGNGHKQAA